MQSAPTGPTVAPGDPVTFAVDIDLSSSATSLIIQAALDPGLRFASSPFGSPYNAGLCLTAGQSFTCTIPNQGTGPIASLPVYAVVANVTDGTTIAQASNSFSAKDGPVGVAVTAPSAAFPTLTITNEDLAVADTTATSSMFEGSTATYSIGLTNNGSAATGAYTVDVALTNGTAFNITCPAGGTPSGNGGSTAICQDNPSLGPAASGSMSITVHANDGAGSAILGNSVTVVPGSGNSTGSPAGILTTVSQPIPASSTVTVSQLTLAASGSSTVTVGQTVIICTTNSPTPSSQVAGAVSGLSPVTLADFVLAPANGASTAGLSSATCPSGQQGVTFTSNSTGTIAVSVGYNALAPYPAATSNTVTVTFSAGSNPAPTLSSINPSSASAGTSTPVTVTLTGSGFTASSVGQWNGASLATTYVSGTQLTASIPAANLASAGSALITVLTPSPGGGTSGSQTFTINATPNPAPTLTSITPTAAGVGGSAFTIVATGANFSASSVIQWNGAPLTTAYGSPTSLSATVPAANVGTAGSFPVTVFTPSPGGGTSSAQAFTVTSAPVLSNLGTTSLPAGSAGFNLVAGGSSFTNQSKVKWNGAQLTTTFNTSQALTAAVPASNLASAGSASITVSTPGYPDSNALTFTITDVSTKLAFATQPAGAVAATAFTTQPVVAVEDANSATVTSDNATSVTLSLVGSGTLTCSGGLTKTASAGLATFTGCAIDTAGTGVTLTATATSLTSATSAPFDVAAAAPVASAQLVVAIPAAGQLVPRSRLTFSATTGTLSPAPTEVQFIVRRTSDSKYWNQQSESWQDGLVLNDGTAPADATSPWILAIVGADRRQFVNTAITVEARATVGTTVYASQVIPQIPIR